MKAKKNTRKRIIFYRKFQSEAKMSKEPISRHIIPKSQGDIMERRFLESLKNIGIVQFTNALEFDKSLFEQLLQLKGICKVRVHNAVNEHNQHTFVVTAVDVAGEEIYFKIKAQHEEPQLLERTAIASANASATATVTEGVGNMADQCSQPEYKKQI
ncbi:hypothetical protein [Ferruginibacter sp. SUN106]|uniref:hypothetical protein n=1 Tax=Ferruginibacter sp. SUN106 TaxID=2978348 RepID=UPI003D368C18